MVACPPPKSGGLHARRGGRPLTSADARTRRLLSAVCLTRVRGISHPFVRCDTDLKAVRAGALRVASTIGCSEAERDDIAVHSYQLMLAAMRGRQSCSAAVSAEVLACVGSEGHGRYTERVRAARDVATRLFGLELLRELCRGKKSVQRLAEDYYTSSTTLLPLTVIVAGSTSAKHLALLSDDPLETCCNIRRASCNPFSHQSM